MLSAMQLMAKIKLQPTPEQHDWLLQTLKAANGVCNTISQRAWESKTLRQFRLHQLVYAEMRATTPLSSQMIVRAIGKVTDSYKVGKKRLRTFHLHGAFPYDARLLTIEVEGQRLSIWTLGGRQHIAYQCGERQRALLQGKHGEADLCYVRGTFYLCIACKVETPPLQAVDDFLGIDLGIVNLATDSDGESHTGTAVEQHRRMFAHRRRNLQRKQTRSARRKLKHVSGKQQRYQTHTNHTISKQLVQKAHGTGRGIALENLSGIRDRVTVRRPQRNRHTNWSFAQLRSFIEYKSARAGVPVVAVDPRNTSRTCSVCGCIDPANRHTQSLFLCVSCGYSAPADHHAARNIRARAVVNQPNAGTSFPQGSATLPL